MSRVTHNTTVVMRCKSCGMVSRVPNAENWKEFTECYACAHKNHPEFYIGKRHHGTGGTYMDSDKMIVKDMVESYNNTLNIIKI